MSKSARAALNARNYLSNLSCARQEGKLVSYCEVFNYLLAMSPTDNIIAQTKIEIISFEAICRTMRGGMSATIPEDGPTLGDCLRQILPQGNIC